MKLDFIKTDKGTQLTIDGKPLFMTGKYLDGKSYKIPVILNDSNEIIKLIAITASYDAGKNFPHPISNFSYNGFMGTQEKGMAPYTAKFIKWSGDPGVVIMNCSDGKERYIPTYAVGGWALFPKDPTKTGNKTLFGRPSNSN